MPQIAQQDYIKAVATPGRSPQIDCNVLSVLAKALEVGTLFDVIIVFTNNDSGDICEGRVLGHDGASLTFLDAFNSEIANLSLDYTPAQYAALSAIQLEVDRLDGEVFVNIPKLRNDKGILMDDKSGHFISNPDGYKYAVTAADGKVASISVSNELAEGDHIVLDEETAQDLIGLPID